MWSQRQPCGKRMVNDGTRGMRQAISQAGGWCLVSFGVEFKSPAWRPFGASSKRPAG